MGSRPIAAGPDQQRKACALLLIAQTLRQRDVAGYSYSGPRPSGPQQLSFIVSSASFQPHQSSVIENKAHFYVISAVRFTYMLNVDLLFECTEAGQMNSAKSTFIICVGSEKKHLE